MNVELSDLVNEFRMQFPKEFTICVQAVQIRQLQKELVDASIEASET